MKYNYTMRDDLSGLRALLRVAQKRSFRAAAAELGVTPSAVSQTIRALEGRLGIRVDLSLDEALTDIVTAGFDAGLRLGESLDREMIAVRVSADQRLVVVGSPAYFAKHPAPSHPRDLHAHDCINLRRTRGTVNR